MVTNFANILYWARIIGPNKILKPICYLLLTFLFSKIQNSFTNRFRSLSPNPKPQSMAVLSHLRRALLRSPPAITASGGARTLTSSYHHVQPKNYSTKVENEKNENRKGKWLTLPPFNVTVNGASLGRDIVGRRKSTDEGDVSTTTAIKWVMRCCPQLPRSLVQKLFRLRQVSYSFHL